MLANKRSLKDKESFKGIVTVFDTLVVTVLDSLLQNLEHRNDQILEGLDVVLVAGLNVFGNLGEGSEGGHSDLSRFGVNERDRENLEKALEVRLERLSDGVKDGEKDVDGSLSVGLVGRAGGLIKTGHKSGPLGRCDSELNVGNGSDSLGLGVSNNGAKKEVAGQYRVQVARSPNNRHTRFHWSIVEASSP